VRRPSLRRVGRRVGIGLGLLAIGVTSCSQGFDDATGRSGVPVERASPGPFVRAGSVLTRYERFGTSGTPIVLVHGFVESTYAWRPVAALLARDHVVYAYDLRGFGYSERRGPYTLAGYTDQLQGLLSALHLVRPVLVGHSLGAAVIAEVARRAPTSVAGIVLADGDAQKGGGGPGFVRRLLVDPFATTAIRLLTRTRFVAGKILAAAWGPHHPHFGAAAIDPWIAPFAVAGSEQALKAMAAVGVPGLERADLARIRVPAELIWGAHDSSVPLSQGRDSARLLRAPLVILPGAGHLSMLASPGPFAAAVAAFAAAHS